jgi:hypothetical protein
MALDFARAPKLYKHLINYGLAEIVPHNGHVRAGDQQIDLGRAALTGLSSHPAIRAQSAHRGYAQGRPPVLDRPPEVHRSEHHRLVRASTASDSGVTANDRAGLGAFVDQRWPLPAWILLAGIVAGVALLSALSIHHSCVHPPPPVVTPCSSPWARLLTVCQ